MSDAAEQLGNKDGRAAVLAAARAVLARGGAELTVRAVCAEAGISRAEFNSHFASKIALMAALVAAPGPVFQQPQPQLQPMEAQTLSRPPAVVPHEPKPETPHPTVPDAWLERRLRVFERALIALEAKAEASSREQARAIALLQERLAAAQTAPAVAALASETPKTEPFISAARTALPAYDLEQNREPEKIDDPPASQPAAQCAPAVPPSQDATQQPEETEIPQIEVAPETGMVLLLPEAPKPETISREEMAEFLASARQAVRNAAEEDTAPTDRSTIRLRWIAAGILGLLAVSVCIGLTIGGTARATQNVQSGAGVVHRQLAVSPFTQLMARADSGDVKAQALLAFAYLRGDGVQSNGRAALRWAAEAAAHGEPVAEYLLGTFYQQGQDKSGVKPDPVRAFQLFSAAAAQGNIKAMHNLAIAYAEGLGIAKDEVQAAQWFERAASHGYVDSAFDLAVLYERGQGVKQSLKDALRWYSIAAMSGDRASADRAAFLRHQVSPNEAVLAANAAASFAPLAPISAANRL